MPPCSLYEDSLHFLILSLVLYCVPLVDFIMFEPLDDRIKAHPVPIVLEHPKEAQSNQ